MRIIVKVVMSSETRVSVLSLELGHGKSWAWPQEELDDRNQYIEVLKKPLQKKRYECKFYGVE